jgi:hypothetical protein
VRQGLEAHGFSRRLTLHPRARDQPRGVRQPNGVDYPRLIPVEYTPLYTGVRQQFGQLGGTYISPWAYDRLTIAPKSSTHVLVGSEPTERPFSLADVIASSGDAPQLTLMLGDKVPEKFRPALQQASPAFPVQQPRCSRRCAKPGVCGTRAR